MKLVRENHRLLFFPEREGNYSIEQTDNREILHGEGKLLLPESDTIHPVYKVTFGTEAIYISEQLVREVNITNFRDIGGYIGQNGKQVKYGCFYRSAPIRFSTDENRQAFQKLNIKNILDLRSDQEAENSPDETVDGSNYIHCSAGKDRTGFGAYLILKTLGVSDDCILQDYILSNIYREEENQSFSAQLQSIPGMKELLYVKEEYLRTSIQALEARYGNFTTYIKEEFGIGQNELKKIQNRYLYH